MQTFNIKTRNPGLLPEASYRGFRPQRSMNEIPKIVLTGGPCAGKSSALAYLYKRLESYGMRPIIIPETATLTVLAGINPSLVPLYDFQKGLIELQIYLENYFENFARSLPKDTKPVLICDRGRCDSKAFCTKPIWNKILKDLGTNIVEIRDIPYKAIIHMITAAEGAEDFYNLESNAARTETPAQARRSDKKLQEAWLGHPHHRIVGNEGDFAHKIEQVGYYALEALGLPEPIETERKFLLLPGAEKLLLTDRSTKATGVEIVQTYLLSPEGEERRVRKRSQGPYSAYFHCKKIPISPTKRVEIERILTAQEYNILLLQQDPTCVPIHKTRYCYFHKNQFQELDVYHKENQGKVTLEVETEGKIFLPPYYKNAREVTGSKKYSNKNMSKIAHKKP